MEYCGSCSLSINAAGVPPVLPSPLPSIDRLEHDLDSLFGADRVDASLRIVPLFIAALKERSWRYARCKKPID